MHSHMAPRTSAIAHRTIGTTTPNTPNVPIMKLAHPQRAVLATNSREALLATGERQRGHGYTRHHVAHGWGLQHDRPLRHWESVTNRQQQAHEHSRRNVRLAPPICSCSTGTYGRLSTRTRASARSWHLRQPCCTPGACVRWQTAAFAARGCALPGSPTAPSAGHRSRSA